MFLDGATPADSLDSLTGARAPADCVCFADIWQRSEVAVFRQRDLPGVELWRYRCFPKAWRIRHWAYAFCSADEPEHAPLGYWYRRRRWTLAPLSVALFEPGEVHRCDDAGPGAFSLLMLSAERVRTELSDEQLLRQQSASHQLDAASLRPAFGALSQLLFVEGSSRDARQRALTHFVATVANRATISNCFTGEAYRENVAIARARRMLEGRLSDTLGLDEVAEASGWSKFYLLRAFNRAVGVPPFEYRRLARLNRVLELLRSGAELAAASAEAGFADQSHMTRILRKTVGLTPAAYCESIARRRRRSLNNSTTRHGGRDAGLIRRTPSSEGNRVL